jgi:carboxypeptidase Taq
MSELRDLKKRLAELSYLGQAASVLGWDQHTYMPPGGAEGRAEQLSTLGRLVHEMFVSADTARLLDASEKEVEGRGGDDLDYQLVRMTRYDYDLSSKLPSDFVAEKAKTTSMAQTAWVEARKNDDFASFAPWLEKNLDIAKRTVDYYGYDEHPYDALLNIYEPKMKTREVQALFDEVRPVVVALVKAIVEKGEQIDTSILTRNYPEDAQETFSKKVVTAFGYDFKRGRLDRTVHPFATSFGRNDCRITTRYDANFLPMALMGTMHEAGHAMYEQNVGEDLAGTPLEGGCSNSVHESQSRMWENLVGRSQGFWRSYYGPLQEQFPGVLGAEEQGALYRALNKVEPSFIRVESDEVTYNLHIILRFEMEKDLLTGKIAVKDAPAAWNAKMQEYLGITPPNDKEGVLQDVHWSMGGMGYFPTYSLGNFLSVQLYDKAVSQKPDIPSQIAAGEFSVLFGWLKENVWQYGRRYFPQELIKKATGSPLETGPYINYLKTKFGGIYGVSV